MELGKQIKKYRQEMNLSQDELADKIYVTRQTISNWENDKNYPDIKSLVLLSSLFDISLDILVKGDLEEMKEQIKESDIIKWKKDSTIFNVLYWTMIIVPIPLFYFLSWLGAALWTILAAVTLYYGHRIEKQKKEHDIQTYREIVAFTEGKRLDEIEKNREYGKRAYQKVLLPIGFGLLTLLISVAMFLLLIFVVPK